MIIFHTYNITVLSEKELLYVYFFHSVVGCVTSLSYKFYLLVSGGYEDHYSGAMYDQYRMYYQYYQNHPMYKEYYQRWMKHYGQAYGHQPSDSTSFYDDRTSIHSGRSSVNDELKKSVSR